MDKDTLSEYMWVIVVCLVGVALLAFASPFGEMLKNLMTDYTIGEIEISHEPVDIADHM